MANEHIIDRIKKLLALAKDSASTNEAAAAALMAQRLIAEHDVSKADLYGNDEREKIEELDSCDILHNPWGKSLAHAVADNFRCRMYTSWSGYKGWTGRKTKTSEHVVFMGYETDVQAATATFDRLYAIGKRLANAEVRRSRRDYGTAAGVRNSFLMGYVHGIRTELEKQCQALVLVRPKAVNDYADERTSGFTRDRSTVRNAYSGGAYNRGKSAGRDTVRQGRLEGQRALGIG